MAQNNLIERLKYLKKQSLGIIFYYRLICFTSFENVTLKFIQGITKMWVIWKIFPFKYSLILTNESYYDAHKMTQMMFVRVLI